MIAGSLRRMILVRLVVAAAGMALMLAACGDDGSSRASGDNDATASSMAPDEADVRSTFKRFEAAFQAGDGYRACRMLTKAAREEAGNLISDQTCERGIAQLGDTAGDFKQDPSKILSVRIDGDKAVASVSDAGRRAVPLPFVKEGGQWKISDLGLAPEQ